MVYDPLAPLQNYWVRYVLWGLAAAAPLILNALTRRRADAIGFGALMMATWLFGRVCNALFTVPESMTLYPVEDALCGALAFLAWRTQREPWKLVLAGLFVLQCCLHASFWVAYESAAGSKSALRLYIATNNGIFALQLLTVGWGALVDVAHTAFRRIAPGARVLHHRLPRP